MTAAPPPSSAYLRSGLIELAALALAREPAYGYQIRRVMADHGLVVHEGTLYPLLHRLEQRGLLSGHSTPASRGRPRRLYELTPAGRDALVSLVHQWRYLNAALSSIVGGPS